MRCRFSVLLLPILLTACAAGDDPVDSEHHSEGLDQEDPYFDEKADGFGTVQSQIGRCTTAGTRGLNEQVVRQINCLVPGTLAPIRESSGLRFADRSVVPYLAATALPDLVAASREADIIITSGYRTVIQQLMIYKWRQAKRCGIKAAARPSRSNHQNGKAIDVRNHSQIASVMRRHGWHQTVPGDDVHFAHLESFDLGHIDVLAFQMLWNLNHPDDPIREDADYGSSTERALLRAPASGFRIGATCE